MKPSVVISEWIQQGRREGWQEGRQEGLAQGAAALRARLLEYLEHRFGGALTEALRQQIESQTDLEALDRWLHEAIHAASLENFRAGLPPQTNGTA